MTLASLRAIWDAVNRWAERQVARRFPFAWITLWALFCGFVLTSFAPYHMVFVELGRHSWSAIIEKRDDLSRDMLATHEPGSHDAKMTYQLVVPAVARVLGLGKLGIFCLQLGCGVVLLWVVARLVHRVTGDLVTALLVTCGVGSTWAGTTAFIEVRGIFDSEALLLVTLSALVEMPWLIAAAVFLASWTDERGLIATSLVFLYHANRRDRSGRVGLASYLGPAPIAVAVGWASYFHGLPASGALRHHRCAG